MSALSLDNVALREATWTETGSNGGEFVIDSDGTVTFVPNSDFDTLTAGQTATSTVTYTVSDGNGGTDTATVTVTVTGVAGQAPEISLDGDTFDSDASVGWTHNGTGVSATINDNAVWASATDETAGPGVSTYVSGSHTRVAGVESTTFAESVAAGDYVSFSVTTDAGLASNAYIDGIQMHQPSAFSGGFPYNMTVQISTDPGFADPITLINDQSILSGINTATHGAATDISLDPSTTYYVRAFFYDYQGTDADLMFDDFSLNVRVDSASHTDTFTEGDPPVSLSEADADAFTGGENDIESLSIVVGGEADGAAEQVTLGGSTFDLSSDGAATVTVGGTTIDITYTAATNTFDIVEQGGGVIAEADVESLIRGATYENTSQDPTAGARTFAFTVTDTQGQSSGASTATITVVPVNDGPTAAADTGASLENGTGAGDVLANDSDPEAADTLTVTAVNGAGGSVAAATAGSAGGLFTVNGDGTYSFDPNGAFESLAAGETATTTVTYTVSDGNGLTDTATLTMTVTGQNDGPSATGDTGASLEGGTGAGDVLANDTDPDATDTLSVTAVNGAGGSVATATAGSAGGLFTVDGDGTYSFDPNGDFESLAAGETATTTVTYTVSDGNGGTDTATLTVTVTGQNDGPSVVGDTGASLEGGTGAGDVLANDTDPDATDTLSVTAVNGAGGSVASATAGSAGGLFTVNGDGTYSFDPNGDFESLAAGETATTTVTYTVSDGNGGTGTATLTMTVTGQNDGPSAASSPGRSAPRNREISRFIVRRSTSIAWVTAKPRSVRAAAVDRASLPAFASVGISW